MVGGDVLSLRRYPVKSMRGEAVESSLVTARGLLGDRCHALVDLADGRVASAKHPDKWATLLECSAAYAGPVLPDVGLPSVSVMLPGGRTVTGGDEEADVVLSRMIGREVALTSAVPPSPTLERMTPGVEGLEPGDQPAGAVRDGVLGTAVPGASFFDHAPLHLVTTATMRRLSSLHPDGNVAVQRFRPNIVVDAEGEDFVENGWVGRRLAIGEEVVVEVTTATPRCAVPTLAQPGLSVDVDVLRTVAGANRVQVDDRGRFGCAGAYALVVEGGRIRRGDRVEVG